MAVAGASQWAVQSKSDRPKREPSNLQSGRKTDDSDSPAFFPAMCQIGATNPLLGGFPLAFIILTCCRLSIPPKKSVGAW